MGTARSSIGLAAVILALAGAILRIRFAEGEFAGSAGYEARRSRLRGLGTAMFLVGLIGVGAARYL